MAQQSSDSAYKQIITKAWSDPAFKQRLLSDPKGVAKEFGIVVPPELEIKVIENSTNVVHLVLPSKPQQNELSEQELAAVAGGVAAINTGAYAPAKLGTAAYAPANLGIALTGLGNLSSGRYGA